MKRRSFFGLMGGAAVAGPRVAKEALAKLPVGLGDSSMAFPPMGGYNGAGKDIAADSAWKLKEIADIKRILTGDLSDSEKEDRERQRQYHHSQVISQSVAALVSVSGVRKLEIYRDRMDQHNEQIRLSECPSRLHWLLRDDT